MHEVTRILSAVQKGDPAAARELLPLVYEELRKLAAQRLTQAYRENTLKQTPLGRIGTPEEIATIVAFLASDDARRLSGRTLLADGGMNDYW